MVNRNILRGCPVAQKGTGSADTKGSALVDPDLFFTSVKIVEPRYLELAYFELTLISK